MISLLIKENHERPMAYKFEIEGVVLSHLDQEKHESPMAYNYDREGFPLSQKKIKSRGRAPIQDERIRTLNSIPSPGPLIQ